MKWELRKSHSLTQTRSLSCLQGMVGVGLDVLAALLEFNARLLHPTQTLPYYT
ncbi:hypothetical protein GCM10007901_30020 [Dyella acidisoli]|uniref:Uncharacterized protein n=1 Tax=Dyella acidisoli TaxID=1867834 RepID=A0ABQ5XS04_9GAMM|nr:hypothetical protein GCM10007901_30020 [Dyella acidisoli]